MNDDSGLMWWQQIGAHEREEQDDHDEDTPHDGPKEENPDE